MDWGDLVVENYVFKPIDRMSESREFLESLMPLLETALEFTSPKLPISWEPRTGTRENRLRSSVASERLEMAMETIEKEIERLKR